MDRPPSPTLQNLTSLQQLLWLFVPIILALNVMFIPLHAGDDYDHFERAYTVAHLTLWPTSIEGGKLSSGGYVDKGISNVIERETFAIYTFPRAKYTYMPALEKRATPWTGQLEFRPFPGSSSYLPLIYLPQAIAIRGGEAWDMTVEDTIFLARILNGGLALALIAVAITLLPTSAASLVVLTLAMPKTLLLFASNSIDPLLHASTLMVLAFCCRALLSDWRPRILDFLWVGLLMLAIIGVRPPMAALGLLPLFVAARTRAISGGAIVGVAIGLGVAWWIAVLPMMRDLRCNWNGDLPDKMEIFLGNGVGLILNSFFSHGAYYFMTFVGELGYGQAPQSLFFKLPDWIYIFASVVLLLAVVRAISGNVEFKLSDRVAFAGLAILIVVGIFFSMSAVCTAAGSKDIAGVQGRYFMAPLWLSTLAICGIGRDLKIIERIFQPLATIFVLSSFTLLLLEGQRIYWMR